MSEDSAETATAPASDGAVSGEHTAADSVTARNEEATAERDPQPPQYTPPREEGFGWRGWVLVGIVVVSFLVVPGAILYLPHAQSVVAWLGIDFRTAYLTLPMIPAILLGATAVWAAVRSRSS
jgi:hypothetical protein